MSVNLYEYRHYIASERACVALIRWPNVHTQAIESQWAHTKPDVMARHHSVSPALLPEYLAESDFGSMSAIALISSEL